MKMLHFPSEQHCFFLAFAQLFLAALLMEEFLYFFPNYSLVLTVKLIRLSKSSIVSCDASCKLALYHHIAVM